MGKGNKKGKDENRKLYEIIAARMEEMHRQLLLFCIYPKENLNEGTANAIYGMRKNLWHLRGIFFDLLVDKVKPKAILKDRGKFPEMIHIH
jgi:hypothetical protein